MRAQEGRCRGRIAEKKKENGSCGARLSHARPLRTPYCPSTAPSQAPPPRTCSSPGEGDRGTDKTPRTQKTHPSLLRSMPAPSDWTLSLGGQASSAPAPREGAPPSRLGQAGMVSGGARRGWAGAAAGATGISKNKQRQTPRPPPPAALTPSPLSLSSSNRRRRRLPPPPPPSSTTPPRPLGWPGPRPPGPRPARPPGRAWRRPSRCWRPASPRAPRRGRPC